MKKIIFIIIVVLLFLIAQKIHNKRHYPQINVVSFGAVDVEKIRLNEPLQEDLQDSDLKPFSYENFYITPVQRYRIAARILRKEHYTYGQLHEVLPWDFALGWNEMSNLKTIEDNHITISQSNRFYFWKIPSFDKISRGQIETHSANVHLSPMSDDILKQLNKLNQNDLIYLEGYLINIVDKTNGYTFNSSLTRYDTGAGACEVLLVTRVEKILE